jgi:hypothetical protein
VECKQPISKQQQSIKRRGRREKEDVENDHEPTHPTQPVSTVVNARDHKRDNKARGDQNQLANAQSKAKAKTKERWYQFRACKEPGIKSSFWRNRKGSGYQSNNSIREKENQCKRKKEIQSVWCPITRTW